MSRKKQKFLLLYKDGENRIKNALDVRKIIETYESMNLLKHLLLSKQCRILFKLQRGKVLEFGGSESDEDTSNVDDMKDHIEKRESFVESLEGWQAKTSVEKKLILGILHRKCHKNLEEELKNYKDAKDGTKSLNQYEMSHLSLSGGASDLRNRNL